jgi:hypothetical protein
MSDIRLKWNRELRLSGAALGREGLSLAAIAAVKEFDGSYKGAMVLAGRLKAVAQAAGYDGYWSEKVDDGFQKQRQILFSESAKPFGDTPPSPTTNTTLDEQERAQA